MGLLEQLQTFCNQSRKKHENSWGDDPLPGSLVSAQCETATTPLLSRVWKTLNFCLQWNKNYFYPWVCLVLRLVIESKYIQ